MVNAGLVKMTIVEDYLANFWKKIFPELNPNPNVKVRTGGDVARMARKDSPKLKEELDDFLKRFAKSGQRSDIPARYLKNTQREKGGTSPEARKRFEEADEPLRKQRDDYTGAH